MSLFHVHPLNATSPSIVFKPIWWPRVPLLQGRGLPSNCRHGSHSLLALLRTAADNIISQDANDAMQRGACISTACGMCKHALASPVLSATSLCSGYDVWPQQGGRSELITCFGAASESSENLKHPYGKEVPCVL
jgi:hypothetical protein